MNASTTTADQLLAQLRDGMRQAALDGITPTELARRSNLSPNTSLRLFNGTTTPMFPAVVEFAKALGWRFELRRGHAADEPAAAHLRDLTTAVRKLNAGEITMRQFAAVLHRCEQHIERLDEEV